MLRRIIYFFLVIVLLGGLGGLIAFYAFDFKPKMIAGFIAAAPKPVETVSAEEARQALERLLALWTRKGCLPCAQRVRDQIALLGQATM